MATSCTTSSIDSSSSSSDRDMSVIKDGTNKRKFSQDNSCEISDEVLELRQIEYEQRLLLEQIDFVDAEKQRLLGLLHLIQTAKLNDKKKSTKKHRRRRQSVESTSEHE